MSIKLIIIGGVAGGATAATRARRLDEDAEIILFERGEYISFANCGLPYYIGEVIEKRDSLLVTTPEALRDRYVIDVRPFSEVISIDRKNRHVTVKDLKTGRIYRESYDRIILSPGAEPVKPPFEGLAPSFEGSALKNIFTLRNIPNSDLIKAHVDHHKPGSAVIVGGGFIGLEMAENLVIRGIRVTVVEMLDQIMAPLDCELAAMVQAHLEEKAVSCVLGDGVKSFAEDGDHLIVSTGKGRSIECDMVILSIGVRPENRLALDAGLDLGERGGIRVDATMRTSDPDIYAVGDAVEIKDFITGLAVMTPLAGPANKQGRIAADNAMGRKSLFKGTAGTAIVKIFDLTAASTGANEKILKRNNIPYLASYTHSDSHAAYYPGAKALAIKLTFSPSNGRILGAQIIGMKGVDKRIDVIATAIRGGMTVYDLEELELAYAPPYSSAKDPVNIARFVASNILKGDVENIIWDELDDLDGNRDVLIDLRNKEELDSEGVIQGAIHIPLNDLRRRLPELDPEKNYFPFCAIGLRSYLAHRILVQRGFRSKILSGGYRTYAAAKGKPKPASS